MYILSHWEQLCNVQQELGNVGLKACIFAYDNISRIMIKKGALGEYSQVEMVLRSVRKEIERERGDDTQTTPLRPLHIQIRQTLNSCP